VVGVRRLLVLGLSLLALAPVIAAAKNDVTDVASQETPVRVG
jgi:hypothetical protein